MRHHQMFGQKGQVITRELTFVIPKNKGITAKEK
jgi:hypothetical protein